MDIFVNLGIIVGIVAGAASVVSLGNIIYTLMERKAFVEFLKYALTTFSSDRVQARLEKTTPRQRKINSAIFIAMLLIFVSFLVLAIYVYFFNHAALRVYDVFYFLCINLFFGFINIRSLRYFIRVKEKGFLEITALVNGSASSAACVLATIGILANKEELAAIFTGIAAIGWLIERAWTVLLIPFLSTNLPASLRDILLSRYIGKWLDARKSRKRATPPAPIASSTPSAPDSQAVERVTERELL